MISCILPQKHQGICPARIAIEPDVTDIKRDATETPNPEGMRRCISSFYHKKGGKNRGKKMKQPIFEIFKCDICLKIHRDFKTAIKCCIQQEVTPLFECAECGNQFYKRELAEKCCKNKD